MFAGPSWANDVPREPGVYAVWDLKSEAPVYVGESSDLKSRMSDVGRSVNHTFRRKAAAVLGVPPEDEVALSTAMSARYDLSVLRVNYGRAEVEEYLILRWRKTLLNRPTKRLLRGLQYKWVAPVDAIT